jgi:hypothetical protein
MLERSLNIWRLARGWTRQSKWLGALVRSSIRAILKKVSFAAKPALDWALRYGL